MTTSTTTTGRTHGTHASRCSDTRDTAPGRGRRSREESPRELQLLHKSRIMGSLQSQTTQESYVRLQGRRWRRAGSRGFRLCPRNRFSVRRLRAELLTFIGLVGRYVRHLVRRLSATSGGGGGNGCGRSGSRRVLVGGGGKDAAANKAPRRAAPFARSNSFYSQAIADCLEFIKRNSVPVEDYGTVSARR